MIAMTQAINARDAADEAFLAKAQLVVNGVLADPTEGPDSSLYEAMGYTRKSERKSRPDAERQRHSRDQATRTINVHARGSADGLARK